MVEGAAVTEAVLAPATGTSALLKQETLSFPAVFKRGLHPRGQKTAIIGVSPKSKTNHFDLFVPCVHVSVGRSSLPLQDQSGMPSDPTWASETLRFLRVGGPRADVRLARDLRGDAALDVNVDGSGQSLG